MSYARRGRLPAHPGAGGAGEDVPLPEPRPLLPLLGLHEAPKGLAAMAREADPIRCKRTVAILDLPVRSVLNRCESERVPFDFTINPYRGCEFACVYCYARYSHSFLGLDEQADFETRIYAKGGAPLRLRRELARLPAGAKIAVGTVTDPYQPVERALGLTRRLLEVLAEAGGLEISITTKSDLVVRDLDLFGELSERHRFFVNVTITTTDNALARRLEPKAPRPDLRLAALSRLRQAGIDAGVFATPILPAITDSRASLTALAGAAAAAGARYLCAGPLFVRDSLKPTLYPFLEREFPHLLPRYRRAFARGAYLGEEYRRRLRARLDVIRMEFGLADSPAC